MNGLKEWFFGSSSLFYAWTCRALIFCAGFHRRAGLVLFRRRWSGGYDRDLIGAGGGFGSFRRAFYRGGYRSFQGKASCRRRRKAQSEERESEEESAATEANLTLAQIEPETSSETETGAQGETGYADRVRRFDRDGRPDGDFRPDGTAAGLSDHDRSCYIRSAPSYDGDILATYEAGTVVEFLEDAGGWYKVRVDGMEGYMGSQIFLIVQKAVKRDVPRAMSLS